MSAFAAVDQQALNLAIHRREIEVTKMPLICNYLCTHGLPAFDPRKSQVVSPRSGEVIGILHLADVKIARKVYIEVFPEGGVVELPLHYLDFLFSDERSSHTS